jgi:predicted kinase
MKDNTPLNQKPNFNSLPWGYGGLSSIRIPRLKASKQTWRRFFKMFPHIEHYLKGCYKLKNMDSTTEKAVKDYFHARERSTVYLMVGIPGSGKSTWVSKQHPDLPVVSRDIIREMLGFAKPGEKVVCTREQENQVSAEEYRLIEKYCNEHKSFIIDDMNTKLKFRREMIDFLRKFNTYIIGVNVNTPVDVCIKRRDGQIPADIMKQIANGTTPLAEDEVDYIINVNYE